MPPPKVMGHIIGFSVDPDDVRIDNKVGITVLVFTYLLNQREDYYQTCMDRSLGQLKGLFKFLVTFTSCSRICTNILFSLKMCLLNQWLEFQQMHYHLFIQTKKLMTLTLFQRPQNIS